MGRHHLGERLPAQVWGWIGLSVGVSATVAVAAVLLRPVAPTVATEPPPAMTADPSPTAPPPDPTLSAAPAPMVSSTPTSTQSTPAAPTPVMSATPPPTSTTTTTTTTARPPPPATTSTSRPRPPPPPTKTTPPPPPKPPAPPPKPPPPPPPQQCPSTGWGLRPHAARAAHHLVRKFGIPSGRVGGRAPRGGQSDHPAGLAVDLGVDRATGDRLAAYVLEHRAALAVKYVIWRQRYNNGSGWDGMGDRGSITANHFDHVHVSFHARGGPGLPC